MYTLNIHIIAMYMYIIDFVIYDDKKFRDIHVLQ